MSEVDESHSKSLYLRLFVNNSVDTLLLLSVLSHLVVQFMDNLTIALPESFLEAGCRLHNEKLLLRPVNLAARLISCITLHRD